MLFFFLDSIFLLHRTFIVSYLKVKKIKKVGKGGEGSGGHLSKDVK